MRLLLLKLQKYNLLRVEGGKARQAGLHFLKPLEEKYTNLKVKRGKKSIEIYKSTRVRVEGGEARQGGLHFLKRAAAREGGSSSPR